MKHITVYTFIVLLLASCGGETQSVEEILASENLEQIRAKKAELDMEQQAIQAQLAQLEAQIKKLDPQKMHPSKMPSVYSVPQFDQYSQFLHQQVYL